VATFAAGLQQSFRMDSMSKPLHAGHAAEAGLTAALAAREGVIGSLDVIDGEAGFGRAMSDGPDWDKALATLGGLPHHAHDVQEPHLLRPYVRGHRRRARAAGEDGRRGEGHRSACVATYKPALDVAGYEQPRTPAEGRFSLKYVVATALTHGSVRFAAFEPARLAIPATRELMRASRRRSIPSSTRPFPRGAPRA
jgi:2-methylcitrate dehydratase PrpD